MRACTVNSPLWALLQRGVGSVQNNINGTLCWFVVQCSEVKWGMELAKITTKTPNVLVRLLALMSAYVLLALSAYVLLALSAVC